MKACYFRRLKNEVISSFEEFVGITGFDGLRMRSYVVGISQCVLINVRSLRVYCSVILKNSVDKLLMFYSDLG